MFTVVFLVDFAGWPGTRPEGESQRRPHPLLEGETPFDLARSSSAGAEAVLNLVRRAEAGIAP